LEDHFKSSEIIWNQSARCAVHLYIDVNCQKF